jgi:hypothetical protein
MWRRALSTCAVARKGLQAFIQSRIVEIPPAVMAVVVPDDMVEMDRGHL